MNYAELLRPDLVFTDLDVENRQDLYHLITTQLVRLDYVNVDFEEKLNRHEDESPTGISSNGMSIAIPHTYVAMESNLFICVAICKDSVDILQMGYNLPEPCRTFFFSNLPSSSEQLGFLQKLMSLMQDNQFAIELAKPNDPKVVFNYLYKKMK